MELVQELVFTALFALLFSYLVAKLVSFSMASGAADSKSSVDEELKDVVDDDVIMEEELQFGQKMNVGILETQDGVEFVEETTETVDKFQEELHQVVEKEEHTDDGFVEEKTATESAMSKDAVIEKSEEIKEVGKESKDGLLSDDDWEGIERSELENVFGAAVKFVESGVVKDHLLSDLQMDLYALHKIATEGPCYDPQPLPLMLSGRVKWNAWQKLGNMNPEEAMGQYVALLSDRVPGWMNENCHVNDILESEEIGKLEAVAPPDMISSFKGDRKDFTHERNLELKSGSEADLTGASSLETSVKELQ